MRLSRLVPLLAVATFLVSAGCDTNNNGGISLSTVAGNYRFTELEFESPGILPADGFTRLDSAETLVRIGVDGVVFYFLEGDTGPLTIRGTASVASGRVSIQADAGNTSNLARYLIPERLSLPYNESSRELSGGLTLSNVNLYQFDPERYGPSLTAVQGTLSVTLERD